ncbi:LysE family transporter [Thalassomonas haliotis]|uniref:LysE family transporter n=1 Tax=Thalassomonas haliotis TaxID=485448 RepID=A0ABY7VDT8_9GAMM|nr:LysE family transporter [Thalassomonas haliotis]WDE11716.1 LysE family transporter [Thalassomonas haliotis]
MDLFTGLLLITSIHLLAAASPGPDFVLVSQQTLRHGKKTGLLISLGITLGLSIHIVYSAFGLAAVIANSAMALWAIKILGGGYLLYLGYQGLKSKAQPQSATDTQPEPEQSTRPGSAKSIGSGFLCNALNPKAPVYFVSLFTLVLSPDMPLYQIAVYGVWMMVIQLGWFSSVVLLLSRPKVNAGFQRFGHWIDRVLGGAMIALGLKLLTSKIN